MSRGIILYQSKYGATKKYVDWLVEELGYDYVETKDAKVANLLNYDVIILGGGVYASGIAGLQFLKKNIGQLTGKKIAVFAVGASPYEEKAIQQVREISYMTFCGNIINKMELGFSYDDANVCDKIADIEIPVLVINSEADTLTPQFMGQEIYDSIQNEEIKMIWTVTDSEHTEIWLDHNQEYREKVQELLNFTK